MQWSPFGVFYQQIQVKMLLTFPTATGGEMLSHKQRNCLHAFFSVKCL